MSDYSLSDLASVTGGDGFGGANSWVLIILFALIFGWGGNGFGNSGQSASQADIQRAVDLNSIQEGQNAINQNVQRVAYENMAAIKDAQMTNLSEIRDNGSLISAGNANIINALTTMQANQQNCCCETKQTIMENRYLDSQNANAIQMAIANGNSELASAIHAEGEATRNMIQQNKIESLQAEVNELKTQSMFCGVPKINPYLYGVYPYNSGCSNAI